MSLNTIKDIEDGMANVMLEADYERIKLAYTALLAIMGNVVDDEVVALVLLAAKVVKG